MACKWEGPLKERKGCQPKRTVFWKNERRSRKAGAPAQPAERKLGSHNSQGLLRKNKRSVKGHDPKKHAKQNSRYIKRPKNVWGGRQLDNKTKGLTRKMERWKKRGGKKTQRQKRLKEHGLLIHWVSHSKQNSKKKTCVALRRIKHNRGEERRTGKVLSCGRKTGKERLRTSGKRQDPQFCQKKSEQENNTGQGRGGGGDQIGRTPQKTEETRRGGSNWARRNVEPGN